MQIQQASRNRAEEDVCESSQHDELLYHNLAEPVAVEMRPSDRRSGYGRCSQDKDRTEIRWIGQDAVIHREAPLLPVTQPLCKEPDATFEHFPWLRSEKGH